MGYLDDFKQHTTVVADTGDFESKPQTLNNYSKQLLKVFFKF